MRKYRSRKGRRKGRMFLPENQETYRGRPLKEILVEDLPEVKEFIPKPKFSDEAEILTIAEYEALRLVDLDGYTQHETGELMGISQATVWRLIQSGRRKIIQAISEGKTLKIERLSQD
ncbi:MAG: DUF134 domain-containing protein [Asgard group archaeon]|nr:DUF134 domain-containing protein [Asgard group archaeon]